MMLKFNNAGGGYVGVILFSIVWLNYFTIKKMSLKRYISTKGTNIHTKKKPQLVCVYEKTHYRFQTIIFK